MTLLRYAVFIIKAVLYPLRLVMYAVHCLFIFLTKPGARIILPLAAIAAGAWLRYSGNGLVQGWVDGVGGFFHGLLGGGWERLAYDYRGSITAVLAFFALRLVVDVAAALCRPFVYALPPPQRPFVPLLPLHVPRHVIKAVPVRLTVRPQGRRRYRGDVAEILPHIPAEIRALLDRKSAPPCQPPPEPPVAAPPPAPVPAEPQPAPVEREPEPPAPVRAAPPGEAKLPPRKRPMTPPEAEREGA